MITGEVLRREILPTFYNFSEDANRLELNSKENSFIDLYKLIFIIDGTPVQSLTTNVQQEEVIYGRRFQTLSLA